MRDAAILFILYKEIINNFQYRLQVHSVNKGEN
jgi:hypothetical protein